MAIDATAVARVTGIKTQYKDLRGTVAAQLPQHIAVFAPGSSDVAYSTKKFQALSHEQVGRTLGWGSLAHLIVRELLPSDGREGVGTIPVTVFPLEDAYEAVAATGAITPTGTPTKSAECRVRIGGYLSAPFAILKDETVQSICTKIQNAITGVLYMPVKAESDATKVDLTAKWAGPTGNDITIEVIGEVPGVDFAVSAMSGGLLNPDVSGALAQIGDVWITMGINGLNVEDTTTLDAFQTFGGEPGTETTAGSGRWNPLINKPLVVFVGNTKTDPSDATTEVSTRVTDCVNVQLVAPGSPMLPAVAAARQVARIARLANNTPAHDYGSQQADGIIPGSDGDQWDYTAREFAVTNGSSTSVVSGGRVTISDVVTPYRPQGEEPPPYRFVVDIVRLQNIIYNVALRFNTPEWDGAPLVNDEDVVTEPTAKKPKFAKALVGQVLEGLGKLAIITDVAESKQQTQAYVAGPKRLAIKVPTKLSGNTNIKDITIEWGFLFGSAPVVE